ncbi:MAG: GT4 family glycosyltransferase PelF [Cellulophaga sp.]|nr:GT4 family glycosyltransferase PelF [Cellulophaga sp.]
MKEKIQVLLITEGTYPYNTGGVSTWAHSLCSDVRNVDYTLYAINAVVESKTQYPITPSVKKIIQVPMWSPEEPFDCVDYDVKYSKILNSRENTTELKIANEFCPVFEKFINEIYAEKHSVKILDDCFKAMWKFFQSYDYKITMTSEAVWNSFGKIIKANLNQTELEAITLEHLTTGMRWIYRFLIPIAIDVPKVDISHITISGIAVLPALALKYKYNTPMMVTEHGVFIRERLIAISASDYSYFLKKMLINFSECITKLVYHHSEIIITVNKFNMTWEKYYGADVNKIKVIYNGVDPNFFKPGEKPSHLKNIPTVVAAARIFDLKDILTMIQTANVVRKTIPNVQFFVYGNKDAVPEYTDECEALIKELGVENNFFLKGFHDRPELLFAEGDISILTSISEGFPYTVIESMSCGIPVVATDVGGVSEALDDSCGFICKPKDYNEIAEKVITLLQNEQLRRFMGENARKKIIENFTIENFISAFEDTYEELHTTQKTLSEKSFTKYEF